LLFRYDIITDMDIVSHALMGSALGIASEKNLRDILIVASFSVLPDITQIPIYFKIGRQHNRIFWLPKQINWLGKNYHDRYPAWAAIWEAPHSVFFLLLVVTPGVLIFHLPKMAIGSYFSHLFVDLFTHKSKWGIKPFWPFQYKFNGITDTWVWQFKRLVLSWLFFGIIVLLVRRYS